MPRFSTPVPAFPGVLMAAEKMSVQRSCALSILAFPSVMLFPRMAIADALVPSTSIPAMLNQCFSRKAVLKLVLPSAFPFRM